MLSVEAFGYRSRSLELVLRGDTMVQLEIDPDPVVLDSVIVQTGTVTIRGRTRDAQTGSKLRDVQVTVYPGPRIVGALNGDFTLQNMAKGQPIAILVEAIEYLPTQLELTPAKDTTLSVALEIDSVALRLIAQQAKRLQLRVQGMPMKIGALGRDEIRSTVAQSIADLIRQRVPRGVIPDRPPYPERGCIIFDDADSSIQELVATPPQLIERVEIVGYRAEMIRVYSKKYVASLIRQHTLQPIRYMDNGLGTVCR